MIIATTIATWEPVPSATNVGAGSSTIAERIAL